MTPASSDKSKHEAVQQELEYLVPLSNFERRLLDDLLPLLDGQDYCYKQEVTSPHGSIFWDWKWLDLTQSCLNDYLGHDGECLQEDYQGDRSKAYDGFIYFLAHEDEEEKSLARAEQLRHVNGGFVARLGARPIEDVDIKPPAEDIPRWRLISTLDRMLKSTWEYHHALQKRKSRQFKIFELMHECALRWQLPINAIIVEEVLIQQPRFQDHYNVQRKPNPTEEANPVSGIHANQPKLDVLSILKRPSQNAPSMWPKGKPKFDEDGLLTEEATMFALRKMLSITSIEDPRAYIHFIPWDELEHVSIDALNEVGVNHRIPSSDDVSEHDWVLWLPPRKGFLWNHHLYTEDQAFEFNVLADWSFPDHYMADRVVFSMRDVQDTDFIADLANYWKLWNDCALTQKDSDGPLFLLETIPGRHFRRRCPDQGYRTALTYFRNLVEAQHSNDLGSSALVEALGLGPEDANLLRYEHSLHFIPQSELYDIDWAQPLGRGANGAVYTATWHQPEACLPTNKIRRRREAVVLKEILPRAGTTEDQFVKILKELDATYTSIVGDAGGCVRFYGVTSVSRKLGPAKILLVFERATHGHILDFLAKKFGETSYLESFYVLIDVLSMIGLGIKSLHKYGVLHRDLHLNNVLVTERYYPNDPAFPHQFKYMITDVGEGKILRETQEDILPTDHWASYGAVDFRAPEVNGRHGWTTKAEVFSFGVIATKILDCRRFTCKSPPPAWVLREIERIHHSVREDPKMVAHIIPKSLKDVLETCLSSDPTERLEMDLVAHSLDDASKEFFSEDPARFEKTDLQIEWTTWMWNETKARGRGGLHTARKDVRQEITEDTTTTFLVDAEFAGYSDEPDMD